MIEHCFDTDERGTKRPAWRYGSTGKAYTYIQGDSRSESRAVFLANRQGRAIRRKMRHAQETEEEATTQ